jgi:dihydrofolate reductase
MNGVPVFVLTHHPPPPETVPKGPSNLTFVPDGIASAIQKARAVAGGKDIKLGGASPGQQALKAGLCDEILIHLAPYILGDGGAFLIVSAVRCGSRRFRPPMVNSRRT